MIQKHTQVKLYILTNCNSYRQKAKYTLYHNNSIFNFRFCWYLNLKPVLVPNALKLEPTGNNLPQHISSSYSSLKLSTGTVWHVSMLSGVGFCCPHKTGSMKAFTFSVTSVVTWLDMSMNPTRIGCLLGPLNKAFTAKMCIFWKSTITDRFFSCFY